MGLFDTIIKTAATKAIIGAGGDATVKIIGAAIEAHEQASNKALEKISIPRSSEDYHGMNFEDIQAELKAYGFTNIALLQKKDLIKGWLTKDGEVESVTIGGKDRFRKKAKFSSNERIVITYHTFRDLR